MDSRWSCPPDSFSVRVSALSSRPTLLEPVVALLGGSAVQRGERADLLARRQPLEERRSLELDPDPRQQLALRGHGDMPSRRRSRCRRRASLR